MAVEAGDRALETAKEIRGMFGDGDNCAICKATVAKIAALIQSAMNAQERESSHHNEALVQAAKVVLETAGVLRAYDVGGDSGDVKPFCDALNDLEDALGVLEGLSELRDGKTKPIEEVRAEAERLLAEHGGTK